MGCSSKQQGAAQLQPILLPRNFASSTSPFSAVCKGGGHGILPPKSEAQTRFSRMPLFHTKSTVSRPRLTSPLRHQRISRSICSRLSAYGDQGSDSDYSLPHHPLIEQNIPNSSGPCRSLHISVVSGGIRPEDFVTTGLIRKARRITCHVQFPMN